MTFTPRNYNHQLTGSEHHVTGSEHHVIGSEHRVTGSGHQAAQLKPEVAPHVAITVNQQRSERDVKKLLQLIRPAWNTDHVTFQVPLKPSCCSGMVVSSAEGNGKLGFRFLEQGGECFLGGVGTLLW